MTPAYARKKDLNHDAIVAEFVSRGVRVLGTYQFAAFLPGFPDLMCVLGPIVRLVEVKGDKGEMTTDEVTFHGCFPSICCVVRNEEEAASIVEEMLDDYEQWKGGDKTWR